MICFPACHQFPSNKLFKTLKKKKLARRMEGSVLIITAMFLRSRVTFHFLLLRMETFLVNTRWLVPCPPPPGPRTSCKTVGLAVLRRARFRAKGSLGRDPCKTGLVVALPSQSQPHLHRPPCYPLGVLRPKQHSHNVAELGRQARLSVFSALATLAERLF